MVTLESYTILVCRCCLLSLANGECCAEEDCHSTNSEWSISDGDHVVPGCGTEECGHAWPEDADAHTENCEDRGFSTSACELCGDHLHGDRYAATIFVNGK